jgi:hypothetical protein
MSMQLTEIGSGFAVAFTAANVNRQVLFPKSNAVGESA